MWPQAGRIVAVLVLACATAVAGVVTDAGEVSAEPMSSFYTPPDQIPQEPGAIIKTQPMTLFVTPPTEQGGRAARSM